MAYGLKYTIPFSTYDGENAVIKIEKKDYTGGEIELQAGSSPMTIEIKGEDFIYAPTRFSTAKICIVGSDYLQELYSTSYQEYRVTLYVSDKIRWCGFIKPEVYTQDYSSETFELEIECMSALSTLEYIDYTKKGDSYQFVTLSYLIEKCITEANALYDGVVMPYVYSTSKETYDAGVLNVLSTMSVSEQDFFDEDGTAMKLSEVLENICKLLSWTLCDWSEKPYFVDADFTSGQYRVYDTAITGVSSKIDINTLSVQDLGFKGGDQKLDILGGYSKVKVKDSNYPVGDIFPEETWNAIALFSGDKIHSPKPSVWSSNTESQVQIDQTPTKFKVYDYTSEGTANGTYTSGDYTTSRSYYLGSRLVRTCIVTSDTTELSYDNCIEIDIQSCKLQDGSRTDFNKYKLNNDKVLFSFTSDLPCTIYSNGCFYITGSVAQSIDIQNHTYSTNSGATGKIALKCKMSIGKYYWTGYEWSETESFFYIPVLPTSKGYTSVLDTKTMSMAYSGASGYIISFGSTAYSGSIKFEMYAPVSLNSNYTSTTPYPSNYVEDLDSNVTAVIIKDFTMKFCKSDSMEGVESTNTDRTYENVVNADFVNEADDIEFKITSYNNDGSCYSKVMLGDIYLSDNLYSMIEDKLIRPEEALIRRIITRYQNTRIKLTQQINYSTSMMPITRLSDTFFVNKKFLIVGGSIDVYLNMFECEMIEI